MLVRQKRTFTDVTDVELRGKTDTNSVAVKSLKCSRRLTESSVCDETEPSAGYLEPSTLCPLNEAEFFPPGLNDISTIDDSIADALH